MSDQDLRYTAEHEWIAVVGEGGDAVLRIGITDYAQEALGDIVFVTLPAVGTELRAPYRFVVIGDPATLTSALRIPGGVVDNVEQFGGQVVITRPETVEVTALRPLEPPRYARPTP